jgi:hypothetical protein
MTTNNDAIEIKKETGERTTPIPSKLSGVLGSAWHKGKPDYACVFITRHEYNEKFEYDIWEFAWTQGEQPENREGDEDETRYYYLAWLDKDGEEYGDINDMAVGEYLVVEILPTIEETHQEWIKSFHTSA